MWKRGILLGDSLGFLDFLDFLAFLDYLVFLVYLDFMENLVYPGISCLWRLKKLFFILLFSRLALSLEKIGCGSEEAKTKNVVFHFALLSPCTIFALTFHTYIYLRLW